MVMNKSLQVSQLMTQIFSPESNMALQDINVQNMNIELVAQMFKNYQSNVLFHLEGKYRPATENCILMQKLTNTCHSHGQPEVPFMKEGCGRACNSVKRSVQGVSVLLVTPGLTGTEQDALAYGRV